MQACLILVTFGGHTFGQEQIEMTRMTLNARFPELEREPEETARIVTRVDETYWGYVLRTETKPQASVVLVQALAGLAGLSFFAAAAAFWVLPGAILSGDVAVMKAVASGACICVGLILLWYASAGAQPEIQMDQSRCELRVVTRNSKGHTRLVARHAFEDISAVRVQRDADDEIMGLLLMHLHGSDKIIVAARAPEHQLSVLRRRIARDLKQSKPLRPRPIVRQVSRLIRLKDSDSTDQSNTA